MMLKVRNFLFFFILVFLLPLSSKAYATGWTNGLYFDGIDDYVRVKYSPILQPTDKVEVEVGVYADWEDLRKRGWTAIVGNAQTGGYALTINSSVFSTQNTIGIVFLIGSSYRGVSIPLTDLTTGYHVFKGGYDGSKIYFYVDGELKKTLNVTGSIRYSFQNSLIIGNDAGSADTPDTGSKYFKGYIDYVKISRGNTVLGEWQLNEMDGLIAQDNSGNGLNAELINGVSWSTFPKGDIFPPNEVGNIELFTQDKQIDLNFLPPNDVDFAGTKIYLNGVFVTTLDKAKTSYSFENLTPNTTYTIKITTFDESGNESDGVTTTVKTKIPIVNDVTDLQADAKYDRVKLTWTPPDSEFFHHVKIYRKKVEQQSFWDQLFGTTSVSASTTSDGYTPMFETNGTYWIDLTVKPETTYSYKVTSVNIEGNESQGVTVETTTPSEPVPVLAGVATTQNENGDYVVTWTSPTKGIVKVLIDGKEYAQVDAATKQIVIKKEDMKTDFFGAYAATLIPIGEYGTKGQAVNVPSLGGKIEFPLSFHDFVETIISILAWVAPFILLSLMFIFWKPIFNFIKKAISERRVKQ